MEAARASLAENYRQLAYHGPYLAVPDFRPVEVGEHEYKVDSLGWLLGEEYYDHDPAELGKMLAEKCVEAEERAFESTGLPLRAYLQLGREPGLYSMATGMKVRITCLAGDHSVGEYGQYPTLEQVG